MKQLKNQLRLVSRSWIKSVVVSATTLFAVVVLPLCLFAAGADSQGDGEEIIQSFDSVIEVFDDRHSRITETILYDFGSNERHGIFRDIPYKYKGVGGANDEIPLSDFEIVMDGKSVPFSISKSGGNVHVKIGNPDVVIFGIREYVISYVAKESTGSFDGYDEIYWNVTGNNWTVPIRRVSARVILPRDIPPPQARLACYYGPFGSRDGCAPDLSLFSRTFKEFDFKAPRELEAGEGMTVAVGFPKGIVKEKTVSESVSNFVTVNGIVVLPLIVFLFMFRHWRRYGKDPKGQGVVVPEFDVPAKLSSLEIVGLMRQGVGANDISAGLIELAVKGYIKIEQIDEKILGIIPKKEYKFIEMKEKDSNLGEPEKELVEALFSKGKISIQGLREVTLSDLKDEFPKKLEIIKKKVMESLIDRGLYEKQPSKVIGPYVLGGGGFFIVGLLLSAIFENGIIFAAFVFSGIVVIIFGLFMPKVTKEGAIMKERILGLKDYLQIAEKDRLKFHNAPEKRPEIFEKLLPVAMALHVEKAWAKEFEGIYVQSPSWYGGSPGHVFSAVAFTNDMHSFAATTSTTVSPHSSSGSGGGGFSGGGGGGGGGGSW